MIIFLIHTDPIHPGCWRVTNADNSRVYRDGLTLFGAISERRFLAGRAA